MRKLRLSLDRLKVESFDTSRATGERGTVWGNAQYTAYCGTDELGCWAQTFAPSNCATCNVSCQWTCGAATCGIC